LQYPDLSAQWRGGTNSWFDPYAQHPSLDAVYGYGRLDVLAAYSSRGYMLYFPFVER
jgi:hypothetical protein